MRYDNREPEDRLVREGTLEWTEAKLGAERGEVTLVPFLCLPEFALPEDRNRYEKGIWIVRKKK